MVTINGKPAIRADKENKRKKWPATLLMHDCHMRWLTDTLAHRALFYDPEWSMAFGDHSNHLGLFATGALPPSILPRQSL